MPTNQHTYRFLIPLAMCYLGFSLIASSLVHKFIYIGSHKVSAGSFVMPFWFIVGDIITEIYGYAMSRKMIWSLMFVEFILYGTLQIFASMQMNRPPSGSPYYFVFGSMLRTYFAVWASLFLANFLNTYTVSKLKILLQSRYFWFRSVSASALGESFYTAIGFYGILGGTISNADLLWLIYWGVLLKITVTAVAAIPANIIATLVKKIEGINVYDTGVNFNPFKIDF